MNVSNDVKVLRDLAKQVAEIAALPIQETRRREWSQLQGLTPTRPLIMATFGMWNVWCREVFADRNMQCQDPFYRGHERSLRMQLFQHQVGDDCIMEPWITQGATLKGPGWEDLWGLHAGHTNPDIEGGAWRYDPPLKSWDDVAKLKMPVHEIDEADTQKNVDRLREAVADILPINVVRGPSCQGFMADISTHLAKLRGLEQVMVDMYESPAELHALLAFMRDGILANQAAAEKAGDYSLTTQSNQAMIYSTDLERPRANSGSRQRRQLWGFGAAQEFTLISPEMHEEFMYRYQKPILQNFGLVHYGCCEDLTNKIAMLRQLPNLRSIAVTPTANVPRCAEQIGRDYVISWRPNPTDMICGRWDEARITRVLRAGMEACKGLCLTIHLKDVETVEGDPDRMRRWTELARRVAAEVW